MEGFDMRPEKALDVFAVPILHGAFFPMFPYSARANCRPLQR
jgi:hypothetical protein